MGKVGRAKAAQRNLHSCRVNFGLPTPFPVLAAADFLQHALTHKLIFKEQSRSLFGGPVTFGATACVRQELLALGPTHAAAALVAKRLQVVPCKHGPHWKAADAEEERLAAKAAKALKRKRHLDAKHGGGSGGEGSDGGEREAMELELEEAEAEAEEEAEAAAAAKLADVEGKSGPGVERARILKQQSRAKFLSCEECFSSLLRAQPGKHIVATQSQKLRNVLRQQPGVPLLIAVGRENVHDGWVLALEPPSDATRKHLQQSERQKSVLSAHEQQQLAEGRADAHAFSQKKRKTPKKMRKGPKQANPLAVKKAVAKKPALSKAQVEGAERRRERQRKRGSLAKRKREPRRKRC